MYADNKMNSCLTDFLVKLMMPEVVALVFQIWRLSVDMEACIA